MRGELVKRILLGAVLGVVGASPAMAVKQTAKGADPMAVIDRAAKGQSQRVKRVRNILKLANEPTVYRAMNQTIIHGNVWLSAGAGLSRVGSSWNRYSIPLSHVTDAEISDADPDDLLRELAASVGLKGRPSLAAIRRQAATAGAQHADLNKMTAGLVERLRAKAPRTGAYIGSVAVGSRTDVRLWLQPEGLLIDGDPDQPFDLSTYKGALTGPAVATSTIMDAKTIRRQFAKALVAGRRERADLAIRTELFDALDGLWQRADFRSLAQKLRQPLVLGTSSSGDLTLSHRGFEVDYSGGHRIPFGKGYLDPSWTREGFESTTQMVGKYRHAPLGAPEALRLIADAVK